MRYLFLLVALLFAGCTQVPQLSDEFNVAGQPDPAKWDIKNDPDPAYHFIDSSGILHIRAQCYASCDQSSGQQWDIGHIATKATLAPPFVVDVRAKVLPGAGMWGGPIWTTGGCLEVDVVEQLGIEPTRLHQSLHNWCGTHVFHSNIPDCGVTLADGYHDYWASVRTDRVEFHVDNIAACSTTVYASQVNNVPMATEPQSFHINSDVHSPSDCTFWTGCPPANAPSPVEMLVDYLRVYTP